MLILALLLVLATPASAGTADYDADCSFRYYCSHYVTYTAAPGERNDVTVTRPTHDEVVIHDAGAPVRGCKPVDANTTRCTAGAGGTESVSIEVLLGDGDDVAHVDEASADGGPGEDRLTGRHGRLTGGPGVDVLTATGPVEFADGDKRGRDRYIGDPDNPATLSYSGRKTDLRVDLRRAGNEDQIENVGSLHGGDGDDVLIGTDAPNTLLGGRGADRIVGLGGGDQLFNDIDGGGAIDSDPSAGDVIEGGRGNDTIHINASHRSGNVVRCGRGGDRVSQTQRDDFVRGDCERLVVGDSLFSVRLRVRRAQFVTEYSRISGPAPHVARAGRQIVARGRRGLYLNALGRAMLRERGRLRVAVTIRDSDGTHVGFRTELQRR